MRRLVHGILLGALVVTFWFSNLSPRWTLDEEVRLYLESDDELKALLDRSAGLVESLVSDETLTLKSREFILQEIDCELANLKKLRQSTSDLPPLTEQQLTSRQYKERRAKSLNRITLAANRFGIALNVMCEKHPNDAELTLLDQRIMKAFNECKTPEVD